MKKPADWFIDESNEIKEIQKRMKCNTSIDGMKGLILDLLLKNAELPFLTLSKEKISAEGRYFCPGVTVFLDNPGEDLEEGLESLVTKEIHGSEIVLRDYELLTYPTRIDVSECEAYGYTAKFLFEYEKLIEPIFVRMYALTILQSPLIFDVKMFDSPYVGENTTFDYTDFIKSIVIA